MEKTGHHAKYCYKRKENESKHRSRRYKGNFVNNDTSINEGFKNLKLFISQVAMSVETNDKNAWYVDFGASDHMAFNKEWFDEYYENIDGTYIYLGDDGSLKV